MIIQECITPRGHRDSKGVPQPDPAKFPRGIKNLCDYLHDKSLARPEQKPRPALCGAYFQRPGSMPGHSIAAVGAFKSSLWAMPGGKGA